VRRCVIGNRRDRPPFGTVTCPSHSDRCTVNRRAPNSTSRQLLGGKWTTWSHFPLHFPRLTTGVEVPLAPSPLSPPSPRDADQEARELVDASRNRTFPSSGHEKAVAGSPRFPPSPACCATARIVMKRWPARRPCLQSLRRSVPFARMADDELPDELDERDESDLHFAAQDGDMTRVRQLLAEGRSPNAFDGLSRTPLHYAAESGHIDIMRVLLEAGRCERARGGTDRQHRSSRRRRRVFAGCRHFPCRFRRRSAGSWLDAAHRPS
jgi:hypothetical protein